MTDAAAPVRIERDGDVAVVVLDNPPLNLFDAAVFDSGWVQVDAAARGGALEIGFSQVGPTRRAREEGRTRGNVTSSGTRLRGPKNVFHGATL